MAREITDRISGKFSSIFAETDTARAMRELKERDPSFSTETFMKTVREYIIPEILDAFLTADIPTLRMWCSEGTFNVLKANFEAQLKPGVVFSGKVLDLRNLEVFDRFVPSFYLIFVLACFSKSSRRSTCFGVFV